MNGVTAAMMYVGIVMMLSRGWLTNARKWVQKLSGREVT